jgi:hypothetical protein
MQPLLLPSLYLKVYRLIRDRDQTIAHAFNDLRRSTAFVMLLNIINEGLFTDDELKQFSRELQGRIDAIKTISHA